MTTDPTAGATRNPGGCLQPVLLRGRVDHLDGATGELLHRYTTVYEPGGVLPVACKTRRASQCPPCADVYRADTYQVIRTGLSGGKGIPETVASHPCVFTTLTAPSFGPVHVRREKDGRVLRCRPRRRGRILSPRPIRLSCPDKHARDDPRLGEPLCPDCYDYTGAVLFNACAPELWRRFTIALRRALARQAGLTNTALAAQVRVSLRQGRRIPAARRRPLPRRHPPRRSLPGRTTPPPAWASIALLTAAIDQATRAVHLQTPGRPGRLPAPWPGDVKLDTRPITTTGTLTDSQGGRPTSPSTPPRPRNAPAPSTAASPSPTGSTHCRSATTPAVSSPNASDSASSPVWKTCAWPPGRTCSDSAATSPARAAPTPSPSALCAPTAPPTSASTP